MEIEIVIHFFGMLKNIINFVYNGFYDCVSCLSTILNHKCSGQLCDRCWWINYAERWSMMRENSIEQQQGVAHTRFISCTRQNWQLLVSVSCMLTRLWIWNTAKIPIAYIEFSAILIRWDTKRLPAVGLEKADQAAPSTPSKTTISQNLKYALWTDESERRQTKSATDIIHNRFHSAHSSSRKTMKNWNLDIYISGTTRIVPRTYIHTDYIARHGTTRIWIATECGFLDGTMHRNKQQV